MERRFVFLYFFVFIFWIVSNGQGFAEVLYSDEGGVYHFGPASMFNERGVWLVNVVGTREEMALQSGALVSGMISDTAFPYYSTLIDHAIETSSLVKQAPYLTPFLKFAVDTKYFAALRRHLSREDRAVVKAFAQGSGVKSDDLERVLVLPDVSEFLIVDNYAKKSLPLELPNVFPNSFGHLPNLGCSTFVGEDATGSPIIGRNLDYEGGGYFDAHAAVYYFHPTDGGLSYVSFGTLGLPMGVLTGTNSAGISLSLHQLMVDQVSKSGRTILSLTDEIIRKSRSLDDALNILHHSRAAGSWRLILSSENEHKTIVADVSSEGVFTLNISTLGGAVTNTAYFSEMSKDEYVLDDAFWSDSQQRYVNLKHALLNAPVLTTQKAVDLLASGKVYNSHSNLWEENTTVGTVGSRSNVQSLVLEPKNRVAYVAVPPIVFAKPTDGTYIPVPTNVESFQSAEELKSELKRMPAALQASEPRRWSRVEAEADYQKGSDLIENEDRIEEGLTYFQKAMKEEPDDYVYPMMLGIAEFLRASELKDGSLDQAKALSDGYLMLLRAENLNPEPYQRQILLLLKARYWMLFDDGEKAKSFYSQIEVSRSKRLAEVVKSDLKKGYILSRLDDLVVDFSDPDLVHF